MCSCQTMTRSWVSWETDFNAAQPTVKSSDGVQATINIYESARGRPDNKYNGYISTKTGLQCQDRNRYISESFNPKFCIAHRNGWLRQPGFWGTGNAKHGGTFSQRSVTDDSKRDPGTGAGNVTDNLARPPRGHKRPGGGSDTTLQWKAPAGGEYQVGSPTARLPPSPCMSG